MFGNYSVVELTKCHISGPESYTQNPTPTQAHASGTPKALHQVFLNLLSLDLKLSHQP